MRRSFWLCLLIWVGLSTLLSGKVHAQIVVDSLQKKPIILQTPITPLPEATIPKSKPLAFKPSPTKAALSALIFPGGGQLYNRKWWKVPIVFAGFGTLGYIIVDNNKKYKLYRDAYIERYKGDKSEASLYEQFPFIDQLRIRREFWRRNRDFSIILTSLFYGITILDATVDAHLYNFNVTDDLDGSIKPTLGMTSDFSGQKNSLTPGLSLTFSFK
jgi:hypothetical protein